MKFSSTFLALSLIFVAISCQLSANQLEPKFNVNFNLVAGSEMPKDSKEFVELLPLISQCLQDSINKQEKSTACAKLIERNRFGYQRQEILKKLNSVHKCNKLTLEQDSITANCDLYDLSLWDELTKFIHRRSNIQQGTIGQTETNPYVPTGVKKIKIEIEKI